MRNNYSIIDTSKESKFAVELLNYLLEMDTKKYGRQLHKQQYRYYNWCAGQR